MSLTEYKRKRSFKKTPEPTGGTSDPTKLIFVVQKHAASHLHYDFRLEMKGVLKSWAVPKGPSMNPDDKRLAMMVEDHPFDYKDFEGIIPEGNYGAGTVIIWDEGTYEPEENLTTKRDQDKILLGKLYSGKSISFVLHGKKLKGLFHLVRAKDRGENSWLLMKAKDRYALKTDITKKEKSVVSGKTLDQVKTDKHSKQWISNRSRNGELKNNHGDENYSGSVSSKSKSKSNELIEEKSKKKNLDRIIR
jgi:bifunctional non-homologous end joining protein LigD